VLHESPHEAPLHVFQGEEQIHFEHAPLREVQRRGSLSGVAQRGSLSEAPSPSVHATPREARPHVSLSEALQRVSLSEAPLRGFLYEVPSPSAHASQCEAQQRVSLFEVPLQFARLCRFEALLSSAMPLSRVHLPQCAKPVLVAWRQQGCSDVRHSPLRMKSCQHGRPAHAAAGMKSLAYADRAPPSVPAPTGDG
jgi:hypothetical protein